MRGRDPRTGPNALTELKLLLMTRRNDSGRSRGRGDGVGVGMITAESGSPLQGAGRASGHHRLDAVAGGDRRWTVWVGHGLGLGWPVVDALAPVARATEPITAAADSVVTAQSWTLDLMDIMSLPL